MLIRRLLPVTILLALALAGAPAQDIEFLLIDNDSIKKDEAPNFWKMLELKKGSTVLVTGGAAVQSSFTRIRKPAPANSYGF